MKSLDERCNVLSAVIKWCGWIALLEIEANTALRQLSPPNFKLSEVLQERTLQWWEYYITELFSGKKSGLLLTLCLLDPRGPADFPRLESGIQRLLFGCSSQEKAGDSSSHTKGRSCFFDNIEMMEEW